MLTDAVRYVDIWEAAGEERRERMCAALGALHRFELDHTAGIGSLVSAAHIADAGESPATALASAQSLAPGLADAAVAVIDVVAAPPSDPSPEAWRMAMEGRFQGRRTCILHHGLYTRPSDGDSPSGRPSRQASRRSGSTALRESPPAARAHYRAQLGAVTATAAIPHGYTLTIWATGAVVAHATGPPDLWRALGFVLAAALAFAALIAAASSWPQGRPTTEKRRPIQPMLAALMAILAVAAIVAAVPASAVWPLAGLTATTVYFLAVSSWGTLLARG